MTMNFHIPYLPARTRKPRDKGLTMVLDKGLPLRQVEDLLSIAGEYIDLVKLGWATAYLTPHLKAKIQLYKEAGIKTFFGGTLLEVFLVRNAYKDFKRILDEYQMEVVEISSGSIKLKDEERLNLIRDLSQDRIVLTEIGSKDPSEVLPPYKWVQSIKESLEAGAWKVITEARESGTVGMFQEDGSVKQGLVQEIVDQIAFDHIIFEAPQKSQQAWFIKQLGANVNLGNIAPEEVIPLETLRLGLRSDTFHTFL
jgi:phosphosulfolactate synthase